MELRQLLRTLRRRWKFATVVFLLGLAGAAAVTSAITPSYKSEARVYVTATPSGTTEGYDLGTYSAQRVASYANLAKDPAVLQRVIDRVGVDLTPEELGSKITATAVPDTVVLQVAVTDKSPEVARELARAESEEIVKLVATLEKPDKASDDKDDEEVAPIVARVVGDASYSADPVSPSLYLNLAIGALLGLLLGVVGALLREMLDNSVKTSEDIGAVMDASVMAVVPFDSSVPKHPLISDSVGANERVEAFRVLRTNMQFVDLDSKRRMLVISSAVPDEGKTVTATNLAITLAQTGRSVLILDCDLRKPRVARLLGLENSVGLLTILVGRATLSDCIQQHESGIDVLATGPLPPNPAEVLETQAMRDLLLSLRDSYDVVIIDAPPLLPVADPAIIAPMADGVLLVTRYGKTSRDLLQQAVGRLDVVGARIVGVVLNMAPRRAISGNRYGYGYGEDRASLRSTSPAPRARRAARAERRSNPQSRPR